MTQATAVIIADSISPDGIRLTTFQLRYWRPIHSELMTHRVFSRNAGSSRARPSAKIIEQVRNEPWGPIHWGANQAGMQALEQIQHVGHAKDRWLWAAQQAADAAEGMLGINLHKQIVNRILEPFTYIDVVVTATDYANWFALRDHPDAQPEIQELARLMKAEYETSLPKELSVGEWHLPYITQIDWEDAYEYDMAHGGVGDEVAALGLLKKASAARCARVSYKPFDQDNPSIEADLKLFEKLFGSSPMHASPAEHIASPDTLSACEHVHYTASDDDRDMPCNCWDNPKLQANFRGWIQFRKTLENEFVPG